MRHINNKREVSLAVYTNSAVLAVHERETHSLYHQELSSLISMVLNRELLQLHVRMNTICNKASSMSVLLRRKPHEYETSCLFDNADGTFVVFRGR